MRKQLKKSNKKSKAILGVVLTIAILLSIFFGINYPAYQKAELSKTNFDSASWMSLLSDDMYLGDINIPGSHDAAAINLYYKDAFARHYTTITKQLESGIRLLDIRLQYKKNAAGGFDFLTCHGNIGSAISLNTYAPFSTILEECDAFLEAQPTETILMTVKVDDNRLATEAECKEADAALQQLLARHKIRPYQQELGSLQEARGQIILFNRINDDTALGYPMHWKDNFDGTTDALDAEEGELRTFKLGVQDHYNFGFSLVGYNDCKADNVYAAMVTLGKQPYDAVFNFASACTLAVIPIYPYREILERTALLETDKRPARMGWMLMDYEDTLYNTDLYGKVSLVSFIIDSNLLKGERYTTYPEPFVLQ